MIEILQEIAKKNEGKCLSEIYVTNKTKYLWQCKEGHQWSAIASNIKQGGWCPYFPCFKKAKKDINKLHELARKNNGECLSEVYINRNTIYTWKCKDGHIWNANFNHILNQDTWCPRCKNPGCKRDINWLHELAKENNGECLSEEYKGRNRKYLWKCKNNHQWYATVQNISRTAWCPYCRESRGEKIISKILSKWNIEFIQEYPLQGCVYKRTLKVDFYLPKLNIIIEYDGIQHFQQSKGSWKTCSLSEIQKRDQLKNQYCEEKQIILIRIPYTKFNEIEIILKEKLC